MLSRILNLWTETWIIWLQVDLCRLQMDSLLILVVIFGCLGLLRCWGDGQVVET